MTKEKLIEVIENNFYEEPVEEEALVDKLYKVVLDEVAEKCKLTYKDFLDAYQHNGVLAKVGDISIRFDEKSLIFDAECNGCSLWRDYYTTAYPLYYHMLHILATWY